MKALKKDLSEDPTGAKISSEIVYYTLSMGTPLSEMTCHSFSLQEHLLKEGLAWLDLQAPGEAHYWLPALFTDLYSQEITAEEAREALP